MRINDILTETEQRELEEGPLGAIGRGVAKGLGGIAKGAGMIAGVGQGMKQAYGKGKATSAAHIAGDVPQQPDNTVQNAYDKEYARLTSPQQAQAGQPQQGVLAKMFGGGKQAAQGGAQDPAALRKQGQDLIKKADELEKQQQQAQKQPAAPAQQATPAQQAAPAQGQQQQPAAEPDGKVEPTMEPTQQAAPAKAAPTQQAAAPADGKLTPQQIAAKKAELQGKRAAGKTQGTTGSGFNQYVKQASSQRVVGANPDGSPKIQQIKASKINLGNNLSEALAAKIQIHRKEMFEHSLASGDFSIFKK